MIKTLQQALKMDREKFKVPRSVQQAIPIQRIWPDGVFQSGTKFSKTFRFSKVLEIETVSLRMSLVFFKMAFLCGQ